MRCVGRSGRLALARDRELVATRLVAEASQRVRRRPRLGLRLADLQDQSVGGEGDVAAERLLPLELAEAASLEELRDPGGRVHVEVADGDAETLRCSASCACERPRMLLSARELAVQARAAQARLVVALGDLTRGGCWRCSSCCSSDGSAAAGAAAVAANDGDQAREGDAAHSSDVGLGSLRGVHESRGHRRAQIGHGAARSPQAASDLRFHVLRDVRLTGAPATRAGSTSGRRRAGGRRSHVRAWCPAGDRRGSPAGVRRRSGSRPRRRAATTDRRA